MLSVTEVKRKLPKEFVDSLYEEYTPLTVDKILMGMSGERNTSLRVNTLKSNIYELMNLFKENNIKFERVNWYKDALEIKNVKEKEFFISKVYQVWFHHLFFHQNQESIY